MAKTTYKEILNQFKEPNFGEKSKNELIKKYGSLDNAAIILTDKIPYDELEKLEQFLYTEITGAAQHPLEKTIERRRTKDMRESMRKSARLAGKSAKWSAVSAIAALLVALFMLIGLLMQR